MPSPQMLDGMRAPRSVRLEDIRQQPEPGAPSAVLAPPGVTVYVAKDRRYRVQITAPSSYVGPDGRKQSGGKMLVAQFDEWVYRNDDRDPKVRALIDEALQSNKYFGEFGTLCHYWLASEQASKIKAKSIESALKTLASLPKETVERYAAQLTAGSTEDHALPTAEAPAPNAGSPVGKTTRPIAPIVD